MTHLCHHYTHIDKKVKRGQLIVVNMTTQMTKICGNYTYKNIINQPNYTRK